MPVHMSAVKFCKVIKTNFEVQVFVFKRYIINYQNAKSLKHLTCLDNKLRQIDLFCTMNHGPTI